MSASLPDAIVIVSAARTPMAALQGELSALSASDLGAVALQAALQRSGVPGAMVDEVYMGNVLSAGQGQAPARQAALKAGLPQRVPCTTLNKMCGSGMKAIMLAHDAVRAGSAQIVLAGGMESMSNAPYLLAKARTGYRLGHGAVQDHMFLDGLEDAYETGQLMGVFAERCADRYAFSRAAQDAFALESLARAQAAQQHGWFAAEITPVQITSKQGAVWISQDEQPRKAKPDKIPQLKPAFRSDGTVTAANASSISDGAAAMLLMSARRAAELGLTPLARIVAHCSHAQAPDWFTTAPVGAIQQLLSKTGWRIADVDLFEINEAFAVVTMAAMHELQIPHANVNIHGGACSLGHPIGASGARIVITLLHALQQRGLRRGVAALCIGGGEATAIAIEVLA